MTKNEIYYLENDDILDNIIAFYLSNYKPI